MSYDYSKLLGAIKEKFGTQEAFAKQLEINNSTLNLRLNGHCEFKQNEIAKSIELLGIEPSDISKYFFTLKV